MKVSCPFLHYPRYFVSIYLKDGRVLNMRGSSAPELEVPVETDEMFTMICESRDEAGNRGHSRMWKDDEWVCYKPEELEAMCQPERIAGRDEIPQDWPEPEGEEPREQCGDGCPGCDECWSEDGETCEEEERVAPTERLWPEDDEEVDEE